MMLRVPSSLNSSCIQFNDRGKIIDIPYDSRVRIEEPWNGNIPTVERPLLMQCYKYLQFSSLLDIRRRKVEQRKYRLYGRAKSINLNPGYDYIEQLINKPIGDYRKFCIWRIFAPYFIHIKRLSALETSVEEFFKDDYNKPHSSLRDHNLEESLLPDYLCKDDGKIYLILL